MRNVEGAKAGSSQKKPYRAPVSVTSTQRMRIKYGISEGTIRGFSAEFSHNEMLKRIYLDGTPIMSAEGEQLLDVVVEFRDGSRDQEPINGLPSISVEHDVGVEVKIAAPVSRSFDRSDTTSYDVRISVPTLYQGDDEGNSNKGLIQFKIDVSTDGGAFEEAGRFEIYEKILNGFAETYNVVVPKGSNHVVRISRLNSEVVSDYSVNRLVVEAITENTDVRLRYTNTAVLYLEYDAEQFSNVPKLEMRVFGKNDILVPANYNGDTHTYATSGAGTTNGVWDGTWKRAYTDNPVWISLDLMISRRYGLGDKIDLTFINKWELYGLAQYCDEAVADGKGGFEPRFTCNNMYLQKSEDAYRVLKDLAASFRAKVVWDGEFITLQADVPRDPVHTFSNANASDITYSSTQDSAQRNLINVQYYDRDNKFASDVVMQRSNSNILSRGKVVDGNFTALGCASQGQAQRIASYVMNTELYETELVSFTTGLEGGLVRLNDVIQMADNSVAGQTVGGRIAAVNGRSITLDRKIPDNVQAIATTQLSINRQDVKNEPISIISISDDRMTAVLASDAPAGTEAGLVWALLTQDLVPQKFVVTDIEFDSTNMTFAVSAIQYNESKYAAIDGSARIVVPPISVTEYKMLKAPIIVIASYLTRIIQDAVVCDIDVSWAQSTDAVQYQLEMQKAGSDWRIVGRFTSLATTLDNMYTGTYTFRVCAYDSLGNASPYTYADPILVAGKVLPPPMLAQYSVIGVLFGYQHKWIYPAHTEDSRAVRLRFTTQDPIATPSQDWQYIDVAYPTATFTEQDVSIGLRTWFSAAIVDKYGNVGAYTGWQSVIPSVDPEQVLDILDGQLTEKQLDQDLIAKIDTGVASSAAAAEAKALAQAATDKINTEVVPQLNAVEDGLSQERIDRQTGDDQVVGQLNTYQLSNDAAVATALDKSTAALTASGVNTTNIEAMQGQLMNLDGTVYQQGLAVNLLEVEMSNLDGVVQTNTNSILSLQGRATAIEEGLATKVETEALQNYYTKQQANDATAGAIQSFNASMSIGGDNFFTGTKDFNKHGTALVGSTFKPNYIGFGDELLDHALFGTHTVMRSSSHWCGFYYDNGNSDQGTWNANEDMVLSFWANADVPVGVYGITIGAGLLFTIPAFQALTKYEVRIPKGSPLRNGAMQGIVEFQPSGAGSIWYGGVMLQVGTKSTAWQPAINDTSIDTSQFATASALAQTNANVSDINGTVTAHTSQLNAQQAAIDLTREIITIRDTRYDNFLPSYYRQYFAKQEVHEFKECAALGVVTAGLPYPTYCTLVTRTQWQDASGGTVTQSVEFDDPTLNKYRQSVDTVENWDTWSAWGNILIGRLNDKAEAAYVNEINNKVTQTENSISALSETVTQNTASISNNVNFFRNSNFDAVPVDGNHWQGVYWDSNEGAQMFIESWGENNVMRVRAPADGYPFSGIAQNLPFDDYRYSGKKLQFRFLTSSGITRVMRLGVHYKTGASDVFYQEWRNFTHTTGYTNVHTFTLPAVSGTYQLRVMITEAESQSAHDWVLIQPSFNTGDAPIREYVPSSKDGVFIGNAAATVSNQTKAEVQEINGEVQALATQTNTLATTVGNNTAAIQFQQSSINGLEAKATLQVEAGNVVGGIALGNNQGVVDVIIRANTFAIAPPVAAGAGSSGKFAFQYRATPEVLANGTVVPAGVYADSAIIHSINASQLNVSSLSAITANFGTWTTLADPAQPNKGRNTNNGLTQTWYDDNNVMRVRIGKLS